MSTSLYSSTSTRSDRVNFISQTGHAEQKDVIFDTSGNFNFVKPVDTTSLLLRKDYRLFLDLATDKLLIQKKIGDVFQTKFAFSFS